MARLLLITLAMLATHQAAAQPSAADDALLMLKLEAEGGSAEAQMRVGWIYYEGLDVDVDHAEARYWFQKAAEQGLPGAMVALGRMYAQGEGGPQDFVTARLWWTLAAEQGDTEAQYDLGVSYMRGDGGPADLKRAYAWFGIAATRGHQGAMAARNAVGSRLDPDALQEARDLARKYYEMYVQPSEEAED